MVGIDVGEKRIVIRYADGSELRVTKNTIASFMFNSVQDKALVDIEIDNINNAVIN